MEFVDWKINKSAESFSLSFTHLNILIGKHKCFMILFMFHEYFSQINKILVVVYKWTRYLGLLKSDHWSR